MDQNVLDSIYHIKENIVCINEKMKESAKCKNISLSKSIDLSNALKAMNIDSVLNNMTELSQFHSTIITESQKKYDILRYHMMHKSCDINNITDLNQAASLTTSLLKLYHMRIGGFNLEDCAWNIHTNPSDELFKLDKHTVLFSNSMRKKLVNDVDSISFVKDITDCINRYLNTIIIASWRKLYDDRRDVYWIIIKLHKTENNEESKDLNNKVTENNEESKEVNNKVTENNEKSKELNNNVTENNVEVVKLD